MAVRTPSAAAAACQRHDGQHHERVRRFDFQRWWRWSLCALAQGPGTLTLAGNYTLGNGTAQAPGWGVSGGTLAISGNTSVADGNSGSVSGGASLAITGTFNSGGGDQIINTGTVTLGNSGTWNLAAAVILRWAMVPAT